MEHCLQQQLLHAEQTLAAPRERRASSPNADVQRVPLAPSAWGGVAGLEYRADNCITPARSENLTQQHGNLDRNGKIAQQV